MSRASLQPAMVGNDFIMPQRRLQVAMPAPAPEPVAAPSVIEIIAPAIESTPITVRVRSSRLSQAWELLHRYTLAAFALLFLLVGSAGIQVGSSYWSAHISEKILSAPVAKPIIAKYVGQNMIIQTDQLDASLQAVTAQPATITVGSESLPISPDMIKSWIKVTPVSASDTARSRVHVDPDAITASLKTITDKYVKAPVDQVTATYADGSSAVIATGANGTKLTDPDGIKKQATAVAENLMTAKGIQFTAPTETQAFAAVTPAAFPKLIEVNVVTKQMYLYDNGQLTHTYPVSAGAPATPTPIGQYKIYEKLPVQDMRGYNADGSKYFQPHVRWINYFLPGGYAVHGNYWRPQSWFGNINSSHGCVSLPDDQAKEVYDWAPIGTTVITHA